MTNTKETTMEKTTNARRADLLTQLSHFDHGDGCLGIIVDEGLRNNPSVTIEELRAVCIEAEQDARVERDRA